MISVNRKSQKPESWTDIRLKQQREVKQRLPQIVSREQVSPLFIISAHKWIVSRNCFSIRIILSCFYLLIFYFEKFSSWIWRLPFAVYVISLLINFLLLKQDRLVVRASFSNFALSDNAVQQLTL